VLYLPLNIVATLLTDPTTGAAEVVDAATATPVIALTPLGLLATVITWASLLGINAWCFWRILRQSEESV